MKKVMMFLASLGVVVGLNGCGGGGGDSGGYVPPALTYYLQTYDDVAQIYRGVPGISYQCGPDSGVTGSDGSFLLYEGDTCTFYGLDETLSLSFYVDELSIDSALLNINYSCDSDPYTVYTTDTNGMFIFDPYFESPDVTLPLGDICAFDF